MSTADAYDPKPRRASVAVDVGGVIIGGGAPVVVFVHGGYWMETNRDLWSHLASGALARGWASARKGIGFRAEGGTIA